jgi:hypothetical protein
MGVIHRRDWNHRGYLLRSLRPGEDDFYGNVVDGDHDSTEITRYFCLTKPGAYTLTRQARIFFADTNGVLNLVVMPPVSVPVRVFGDDP